MDEQMLLVDENMPGPPANEEHPDDGGIFFVTLMYKGKPYEVPVETGDAISSIFDFVLEVPEMHDFPRENCKLISKGKVFRPDDIVSSDGDIRLVPGAKLMLMATSAHDVSFVKNNRADPLVKGFAEEERDDRNRQKRARAAAISAWGTKQDSKFRFNSIKAEFKYSTPSPYDAEKLLQKLATDPGIVDIMKSRSFEVGILTEMSPSEAADRMAKKGTPGVDLLGYNQNAGEMIVLKLRTDNTKGFRPYHDLINTLIHEMTHNVWGPHDHNFWKLFGELKAQYMKFHRFWSHGGRAADSNASSQFQGFASGADDEEGAGGFGQVLGSTGMDVEPPQTEKERRDRALLAAEARKVTASTGIDFVNSNGKVIFVCPCGQVHDPGYCPLSTPAAAPEEMEVERSDEKPTVSQPESSSSAATDAHPVSSHREDNPADASSQQDVEMAAPVIDHGSQEGMGVEPSQPGDLVPAEAARPSQEFEAEADVGPFAGLSEEDLKALGLGGAAEWLQNFTQKLQLLTRQTAQPTARQALELLLRLVRNIVSSPHEQKFRRIKADNPKIRSGLLSAGPEVEKLIALLGFEDSTEDGGRVFVLRDASFDSARLQMGQDMLERHLGGVTVSAH